MTGSNFPFEANSAGTAVLLEGFIGCFRVCVVTRWCPRTSTKAFMSRSCVKPDSRNSFPAAPWSSAAASNRCSIGNVVVLELFGLLFRRAE